MHYDRVALWMVEFQDGGVNVAKTVSFPVSFPSEGGFVLHSFYA